MQHTERDFTILHNRLYARVFAFVHLRVKDSEEVKDIVQDVFLKAYNSWKNKPEGLPDENTARNYLFIIAKQRMIDLWRSSRSRFQVDLWNQENEDGEQEVLSLDSFESPDPLPAQIFEETENKQNILQLLNQLRAEEREILILRFLEELEYKELAQIYKTSEVNIRQKVSRSLQNLRKVAENKIQTKI